MPEIESKLRIYYFTAVFSVIFATVGFSYNAWRLEVSEDNSNIRMASFQLLNELAELEQIIYASHYDKNLSAGNPRIGWVKIGLISDLSELIDSSVTRQSQKLHSVWKDGWQAVPTDRQTVDKLIIEIDNVRKQVKEVLYNLD